MPPLEGGWFLQAVKSGIDFQRIQFIAHVGQFTGLRQAGRIEDTAPGCEAPSADTDEYAAAAIFCLARRHAQSITRLRRRAAVD